jgi:cytochrome c oxidase subunit 2
VRPPSTASKLARRVSALAILALAATASPAAASVLAPPEPHSPNAERISDTYWVMLILAVVLAAIVLIALAVAVFRFRERPGSERPRRLSAGRGVVAKPMLGLAVIAIAIFIFGIVMTDKVREIEPSGPEGLSASTGLLAQVGVEGLPPLAVLEDTESASGDEPLSGSEPTDTAPLSIDVIGQQWLWRFEYPGGTPGNRVFSYNELVVPVDTAVVLNLTSVDVLHRWFVPELGGQVDAIPGVVSQTWFKADEPGVYRGQSTLYSGTSYPAMRIWVRALPVAEYEEYVDQLAEDLESAQQTVAGETAEYALEPAGDAAAAVEENEEGE